MPVNVKLSHKDLRFLLYENRELELFYALNVHSESLNHVLFLFRDRMFSCQTPFFPFLGRNMHDMECISWLPAWHCCRACLQCLPALLSDMISPDSVHLLHMLCSMEVCEMLLWHCLISICLYTGALAYCKCSLQQQFKGLCRDGETLHSGGLCAVDNRPVTCLMKVVRRQICRFVSPHSDTMS